jgi:hypothetical protein
MAPKSSRSKWFTRGWTLQELLAPKTVVFFDQDWVDIGTKSSLAPLISAVTGIKDLFLFKTASVAQKMSWAAKRETTRVEDRAYCLMGLFEVNMPLLYGEGEKAFLRLQLEILRTTDDESIFAWTEDGKPDSLRKSAIWESRGLLASSPTEFGFSGDVQRRTFDADRPPYSMTNKGLRIEPLLVQSKLVPSIILNSSDFPDRDDDLYLMPLNCGRIAETGHLAIYLRRFEDRFMRAGSSKLIMFERPRGVDPYNAALQRIIVYVREPDVLSTSLSPSTKRPCIFSIRMRSLLKYSISVSRRFIHVQRGMNYWDKDTLDGPQLVRILGLDESYNACAEIWFTGNESEAFSVVISPRGLINLLVPRENQSLQEVALSFASVASAMPFVDRISKRLRSGRSVSVSLKKAGDSRGQKYWIDVTVDPEGYLQWPEPLPLLL